MKILRGELRKYFDTQKGGSEKVVGLRGAPKKLNRFYQNN